MHDVWQLVTLCLAGMALSALYFVGLWWTVRSIPQARHPWALYFVSTAVRLLLLLTALYLLMAGDWRRAVACVTGFFLMRLVLLRWFGWAADAPSTGREATHE